MFLMGDKECCIQREERGERDKEIETDTHTHTDHVFGLFVCVFISFCGYTAVNAHLFI